MSKLYADCQNLAGWIKAPKPNYNKIVDLVRAINTSTETDKANTIYLALKRMPSLKPYINEA